MATEFELKYAATPALLAEIQSALPGEYRTVSMETTYYDTPGRTLSGRKWTLRRRFENGVSVCTLKTPAGGLGRHEWELERSCVEEAIPELCKLSGLSELAELTGAGVQPVCGARFIRQACMLELGGATAELALDEGVLFGGGRALPLAELEVELKSGDQAVMLAWGKALAHRFGLKPEKNSKFRRALSLAEGE